MDTTFDLTAAEREQGDGLYQVMAPHQLSSHVQRFGTVVAGACATSMALGHIREVFKTCVFWLLDVLQDSPSSFTEVVSSAPSY